jgi:hypothetical protein
MRNFVHRATSRVVLNTGRSLRFMMVQLNKFTKYYFGMNCMPPNLSGAISQKTSVFI